MNPQVSNLIEALTSQHADLQRASKDLETAELFLVERKQEQSQAADALSSAEAAVGQDILADTTLTNESKRQNALRTARAKDLDCIEATKRFRDISHQLAIDQQTVKQLTLRKNDLELHGRNLRAAAELLAASLHEMAQAKRQVASQQFLQGTAR